MVSRDRKRILWINDAADLSKLPNWLAARPTFGKVVALSYPDTGAVALCFFDGDYEAGIIRCANEDLAGRAESILAGLDVAIAWEMGGET